MQKHSRSTKDRAAAEEAFEDTAEEETFKETEETAAEEE